MIIVRLCWYLEKHNLINPYQCAFMKNKNTKDHLFRLQDDIRKSLNNKQKTVTLFLDIEKAYDMLWKEGLLYKLFHLGIRGKLFNWIQSFLKNRLIQVKINDSFSQKYEVQNRTPQGSCLSPILFLIMINDITIPDSNVRISLFADDIALWISGINTEYCIKTLQNTLDVINSWSKLEGYSRHSRQPFLNISHIQIRSLLIYRK